MEKIILKLSLRKLRGHLPQFIGMGLLVVIGVAFFVTLFTIYMSYEQNAERFFDLQNYADVTFYGSFEEKDVELVLAQEEIRAAQGRHVQDFKNGGVTLRVVSLTDSINVPFLYEGRFPKTFDEGLLINKHAQARKIKTGDILKVGGETLHVTGIVASPEYIYLAQNERVLMAKSDHFGVLFVPAEFFDDPFNQIVAKGFIETKAAESIGNLIGASKTVLRADKLNYNLFREDLEQIRTFAYIFPLVFALLIVMIVYVTLSRSITKERRHIGIYKAQGVEGAKIIFVYVAQAGIIALIGSILGCVVAMLLTDTIIGFFSAMFEVPGLVFVLYPMLWTCVILASVIVSVFSAFLSVWSVLKPMPVELMCARMPSVGKRLLFKKPSFLWNWLSFNTRYAFKSTLRNKGLFLAVVLGISGSCALLTFAFGFFDSAEYTQRTFFEDFARYDVLLEFKPIPLTKEHPVAERLDSVNKALAMPVRIDGSQYRLIVVENDFDMKNIDTQRLKDGVIIPTYFARKWGVSVGDKLNIRDTKVKVSGLSEQNFGLAMYTSFDYATNMVPNFPLVYNTIFARGEDLEDLTYLSRKYDFSYSTLEDARASLASIMESLYTLIWFMLSCAVVLGLAVIYSVGLMNLSAREYEYMFISVMGYSLKSIALLQLKETVLQLLLAIPAGIFLGYEILNVVKTAFSGDNFVLLAEIFSRSYLAAGIMVASMAVFMTFVSIYHINGLDVVGGLKVRDE